MWMILGGGSGLRREIKGPGERNKLGRNGESEGGGREHAWSRRKNESFGRNRKIEKPEKIEKIEKMSVVRAIVGLEESRDFAMRVYEAAIQALEVQEKYIEILIGYFHEGKPTLKEIELLSEANQAYGWCGNAAVVLGSRAEQFEKQFSECRGNSRSHRRRLERESAKLYDKAEILLAAIGAAHQRLRELGEIAKALGQREMLEKMEEYHAALAESQASCGKVFVILQILKSVR